MSEVVQRIDNPLEETPVAFAQIAIRKARISDAGSMFQIINHYAKQQLMLSKTQLQLYESLRDYSVAVDATNDLVVGCGALHIYWENLAELRALAVLPGTADGGIGTSIVRRLLDEANEYGLEQVFLFTYVPGFFRRFGFTQVEHRTLPLKVYNECFNCPKFNTCDEVAMVLYR